MTNLPNITDSTDIGVSSITASEITPAFMEEWRELADNTDTPNPFFLPWFLEPAMRFLDSDNRVRLLSIRRDEEMIGLAPLVAGSTYAKIPLKHYSIWKHDHCYNGAPLIRRKYEADFYSVLFRLIDTHPEGARFIRLTQFPLFPAIDEKFSAIIKDGRQMRIQHTHERAILTRRQDFETHMASVYSGKKRKELRRQAKRFGELGTAVFETLPINNETITAFIELENAGWKSETMEGFPIARSDTEGAFFREAMLAGAQQNAVQCLALTLDNKPVAMLFSLKAVGSLHAFKTTYDEHYAAYSPGTRLIVEATRRMLKDPSIAFFDSCARAGHPVVSSLWPERLRISQINISANSAMDKNLLSFAAGLENLKSAVTKQFRH